MLITTTRLAAGALLLAGALFACSNSSDASGGAGWNPPPGTGNDAGKGGSGSSGGSSGTSSGGSSGGTSGGSSGGSSGSSSGTSSGSGSGGNTSDAGNGVGGDGATGEMDGTTGMDAPAPDGGGGNPSIPAVKLVVYLDDWSGGYGTWATKIDFTKMTHMNLAFVEATTDNNWNFVDGQSDADVKALVDAAHAAGVKVLASLGGGGTDTTVVNQYTNPSNDDALVSNVDAFLKRLNLDGADVDVEKESTNEVGDNYGMFVSKLIATLRPEGKLVTAAVAQYLQGYMNDDTLHSFDYVNIMTYSGDVGAYMNDASFYTGQKGMDKTKITLGLISGTSVATTQAVTQMSKNYGGVMLWDLAQDSTVYTAIQGSL